MTFRSPQSADPVSRNNFRAEPVEPDPPTGGMVLVSPSVIGSINRGRVLQALYDNGPTSRADLARLAGVNRTTVTGIVQPMMEEGLLLETEAPRTTGQGGKPARPIFFNPDAPMLGAVLLLPGIIQTALVTLTGEVRSVYQASFDPSGSPDEFRERLFATMHRSLVEAPCAPFGIGVATGGMIDRDRGVILTVSLAPVLVGMPLVEILGRRFSLPVVMDHHPRALLVGDRWFGPGRGQPSFAAIYTGEVLGGAFYMNGQVYRGLAGSGGELGHTLVQLDGLPCNCGKNGCWETVATLSWLRREAHLRNMANAKDLCAALLVEEAGRGSSQAAALLDLYARNLAVGIANLQQTLSLNFYVLHGDAAMGGHVLADLVRRHVDSLVLGRPNQEIVIVAAGKGDGLTALRGAAGLVISDRLKLTI